MVDYAQVLWTKEAYSAFLADLKSLADPGYKVFHEKLCTTASTEILGVRSPESKRIAKGISKGDAAGFLALCGDTYYEELLIKGFVLAYSKQSLAIKRPYIEAFLPQIDNWAICDSFCVALKPKKGEQEELFSMCQDFLQLPGEYDRRVAIVLMMSHLMNEAFYASIFKSLAGVCCDVYYVHMAVAWCVSVLYVHCKAETTAFLQSGALDVATHNKAIQKICESHRVDQADKVVLRTYKC